MNYIRLADAADIYTGWQIPRGEPETGGHPLRAISLRDITDGHIVADGVETVSVGVPAKVDRYLVQAGDILVACRGTVSKVAIVPPELAGALLTSTLIGIRMDGRLFPEVVFVHLRSGRGQRALMSRVRSATQQIALAPGDIAQLEVPLPPMDVQRRIADLVRAAEWHYLTTERAARLRRQIAYRLALGSMEGREAVSQRTMP